MTTVLMVALAAIVAASCALAFGLLWIDISTRRMNRSECGGPDDRPNALARAARRARRLLAWRPKK